MNWIFGFTCGVLIVLGYNRIYDEPMIVKTAEPMEIIEAYQAGRKEVLRLNPIDPALESACVQLWGRKQ